MSLSLDDVPGHDPCVHGRHGLRLRLVARQLLGRERLQHHSWGLFLPEYCVGAFLLHLIKLSSCFLFLNPSCFVAFVAGLCAKASQLQMRESFPEQQEQAEREGGKLSLYLSLTLFNLQRSMQVWCKERQKRSCKREQTDKLMFQFSSSCIC